MGPFGSGAMTSHHSPSTDRVDERADWLDALLQDDAREHAANYIHDEAFTVGVMERLPAPVALPSWRKPVVIVLWLVAGILLASMLPQAMLDVAREAIRVVAAKPVSLSMLAAILAALGIATWTGAALALRRD
jgi:hypothetical protein